jgi:hypothetical protein
MDRLLTAVNVFFDVFTFGSGPIGRYISIGVLSLVSAVIFLVLFKQTSNQARIQQYKNKIFGHILQMGLYKDRLGILFSNILNILRYNILYVKETVIPLLVICVPLVIFTVQVNNRSGYDPIKTNQDFIIRAVIDTNVVKENLIDFMTKIYCKLSPEILLETPPLRIVSDGEVFWLAKVLKHPDRGYARIQIGVRGSDLVVEKRIVTDYGVKRFSSAKDKWSFSGGLINNAEGFISKNAFLKSVSINYKRANYSLLFWPVDSIVLYLVFTLICAFALKGLFKVTI